jgi:hypothetical protein
MRREAGAESRSPDEGSHDRGAVPLPEALLAAEILWAGQGQHGDAARRGEAIPRLEQVAWALSVIAVQDDQKRLRRLAVVDAGEAAGAGLVGERATFGARRPNDGEHRDQESDGGLHGRTMEDSASRPTRRSEA